MTDAIQKAREALASIPHGAIDALANNQRQLDMDGCEVGVSRQAVDEVLAGLRAALAALDAETEVKVRELEWSGQSWGYIGPLYESETMLGTYTVEEYGAGNWCTYFNRAKFGDTHATEEAAKDAVQAHYERRIRSALVPPEARS